MATSSTDKTGTTTTKTAQSQADAVDAQVKADPSDLQGPNVEAGIVTAGVGPDTVVIKSDGTVEGSLTDPAHTQEWVTLNADVVEEFFYPGTKRPAHKLLFTKGQTVRKAQIDELNERANKKDPTKVADVIDATTYASGTGANARLDAR